MTIKQNGGIFGRNPEFNDVEVKGTLTAEGSISVAADSISGDAIDGGTPTPTGLAVDGNVLYVDSVNNRVGINTSTVDDDLHIEGSLSGDIMGLKIQNNNVDADSRAGIKMATANGTWTFAANRSGGCALVTPASGTAWTTSNSGNLAFPSGKGIDFSATAGTGTSELFDDYEEGTFTATLTPTTSGSISLFGSDDTMAYTKMGRTVHINGRVRVQSVSSPVGAVALNLPFAIDSGAANSARCIGRCQVWFASEDMNAYGFTPTDGSSSIDIIVENGNSSPGTTSAATFSGNEYLAVSLTYAAA